MTNIDKKEFSKKIKKVDGLRTDNLKLGEYIITKKEKASEFVVQGDSFFNVDIFKYNYTIQDINLNKPIKKVLITSEPNIEDLIMRAELKNIK